MKVETERQLSLKQLNRLRYAPGRYQKLYRRCLLGKASLRDAVKAHCLECWGWILDEAATCDNEACPLYAYRPYQSRQSGCSRHFEAQTGPKTVGGGT